MSATDPTVYVIDDDSAARQSLHWLVESIGLQVKSFPDAQSFLDQLDPSAAGCLLLDVRMPGMSGLELQERLIDRRVTLPVIMITGHADVAIAVRSLKRGAVDFIEKPYSEQDLLDSINKALKRDQELRSAQQSKREYADRLSHLTAREREVLYGVVSGKSNRAIASELEVSPKTVEVHRANVMAKVRADSLAELVRIALIADPQKHLPPALQVCCSRF